MQLSEEEKKDEENDNENDDKAKDVGIKRERKERKTGKGMI